MRRVYYMILVALGCTLTAAAQDGHGDVVVHADPRLAVLMKKKHADAVASLPKTKHTDVKATTPATLLTGSVVAGVAPGTVHTTSAAAVAMNTKSATLPLGTPPPVNMPPGAYVPVPEPPPAPVRAPIYIREKDDPVVYAGKGFRVQIYSGADRERAISIKTEFMRNFPGVRTYLTYVSPTFRVKVGNFRSRAEAMSMYRQAKDVYSPCVIVPDNITINIK